MRVEEVVDAVPGVAEDMFATEVVKFAGVNHEIHERAFAFLEGLVDEPHRFEERDVDIRGAVKHEQRTLEAVDVGNG